jgi:serine/threonine-protein kinase
MTRALGSRYRLAESLGTGAAGEVYAGTDTDDRPFAFKLLREELAADPDAVSRFLRERSILVGLRHPNLVAVHDLVAEGNTVAIVMDLVHGGDLRAELTRRGTVLPAEVARIGAAVARALGVVHAAGVVHRDVKPENILMDDTTAVRTPRLTDFGIASLTGTGDGVVAGTPRYLAPELLSGEAVTAKADLYSLGIVLYELCCGNTPFTGASTAEVVKQQVERAPGRPEGVPDPLWELINWLLRKSPRARPQSAGRVAALLDAMTADLADQPVAPRQTKPPTTATTTTRPAATTQLNIPARSRTPAARPARPLVAPPPARRKKKRGRRAALLVAVLLLGGGTAYATLRPGAADDRATVGQAVRETSRTGVAPTTTDTSVAALTSAPDLVGKALPEAQDMLPTNLEVEIVDVIQQGVEEGTVVAQEPGPGEPLQGSLRLTVARGPVQLNLDEYEPVAGGWTDVSDPVSIAGKSYLHSLVQQLGYCDRSGDIEYNLSKGFRRLSATAGIDDNARVPEAKAQLEIYGDGRQLTSVTVEFGKPTPLDVDMSGVLRLRFHWQLLAGPQCSSAGYLVLGEAALLGLPGEVPSTTPTTG